MDIELGLSLWQQFQREGWNINLTNDYSSLVFEVPTQEQADSLIAKALTTLAASAMNCQCKKAVVRYPGCDNVYTIPARMADSNRKPAIKNNMPIDNPLVQRLLGADYIRLHEFLIEQKRSGNIVIITSNITRDDSGNVIVTENPIAGRDICHHTSDELTPQRAHWSAAKFTGYNYRLSWRRDFNDYEHLNPQYHRLKELLQRDGHIDNYEYTLYRPDGALCSYATSYYLCRDYLGDEVRIGISRPGDWQLLSHPEELRAN